jgi:hypothetical protein
MARQEHERRDTHAYDDLLGELAELRELDRRRQAQAPGSPAHDAATLEVDLRSRRLMDRFRDLPPRVARVADVDGLVPLDAAQALARDGRSRLN